VAADPNAGIGFGQIQFHELQEVAMLGMGTFSRVKLVRHKATRHVYALKCMEKTTIDKHKQTKHIMNAKKIMQVRGAPTPPRPPAATADPWGAPWGTPPAQEMNHPFLVRVFATYKDSVYLYMLLELCQVTAGPGRAAALAGGH
jgi:serine/threonine protein kinase